MGIVFVKNILGKISDQITYRKNQSKLPIFYFDRTLNVGDVLNPYLVSKVAGKDTFLTKHRTQAHLLAIGSIMHFGTPHSHVWGSGVIECDQLPPDSTLKRMKFYAVRGKSTKQLLQERGVSLGNLPLGDPAVLTSTFYTPKRSDKRYKVGIVPHFVDFDNQIFDELKENHDIRIIDVRQHPESFIDQLCSCDHVLSSSLHGLILADTYNIPNAWVRFSDRVIGGNFKFLDYYSTTDMGLDREPLSQLQPNIINDRVTLNQILTNIESVCRINKYIFDKKKLMNSFPDVFV